MTGISNYLMLKGENCKSIIDSACYTPTNNMCDFLIFFNHKKKIILIIELTSGLKKEQTAIQQLKNACILLEYIINCTDNTCNEFAFRPIFVYNKENGFKRSTIEHTKLQFNNIKYPIITCKCGTRMTDIFLKYL